MLEALLIFPDRRDPGPPYPTVALDGPGRPRDGRGGPLRLRREERGPT